MQETAAFSAGSILFAGPAQPGCSDPDVRCYFPAWRQMARKIFQKSIDKQGIPQYHVCS